VSDEDDDGALEGESRVGHRSVCRHRSGCRARSRSARHESGRLRAERGQNRGKTDLKTSF